MIWYLVLRKKYIIFVIQFETGCSAVRLAHLLWEQGVVSSNPTTPTLQSACVYSQADFFLWSKGNMNTFYML